MTFRRTAATAAVLGAIALAGAPLASAAPTPKPKPDATSSRAVPGTSCTVGQLRAAIDRSSPGLMRRLDEAAGGSRQFAEIVTSSEPVLLRQVRVAGLAFQGTGTAFGLAGDQQNVQRAVANAYRTCASAKAK